jgi:hypothetical protein
MSALSQYRAVLDAARARLHRLTDRAALGPLKRLYDEALAEIERKLRTATRGTMGAAQLHALRRQAMIGIADLSTRMGGQVAAASHEAQVESIHALTGDIHAMGRAFGDELVPLPIEEASRFRHIVEGRRTSLLSAHSTSVRRWGGNTIGRVEHQISLGLAAGEEGRALTDRVLDTIDGERWQAERIVRTETAWAYSATQADAMKEQRQHTPDLMMRWNEHCTDDYEPLDERVGVDSLALHGQVAIPGGLFYMPPTTVDGDDVPDSLVGQAWEHPPDRPHDRAVLSPFRKKWGVPGWVWIDGARVDVHSVDL